MIAICLALALVVILMLGYYHQTLWQRNFLIAVKNCVLPLATLGILGATLVFKPLWRAALLVILALTIFGQFYFANKYVTLGDKQFLYPPNPVFDYLATKTEPLDRFIAFGAPILGDFATQFGVYSPEGYDPIYSKRYGQLAYATRDFQAGRLSSDLPRIEVMMSQLKATDSGELVERVSENQRRLKLLSLLGVRNFFYFDQPALIGVATMFPAPTFLPQVTIANWRVFQYTGALPRAFLVDQILVETDPQKILDKIFDPKTDLSRTLVLEEKTPTTLGFGSGTAKIISYESEKVTIETEAGGPKMLFLSDNYYPGWQAAVDGQEAKIYRADFSFRAVFVPAGKHLVQFNYQPKSLEVGKDITLTSLVLLAGSLLSSARRRK